jgi:hypothetical protein
MEDSVENIPPFLTRDTGYGSPRSSVSINPGIGAPATTSQTETNWQQHLNDNLLPQSHSYVGDGNSLAPEIPAQTSLKTPDIDQASTPKISRPLPSLLQLSNIWRWELSTWALGTAGYSAIIILMIVSNNKLQKDWHSDIQITAFIAALAQVSQSALLVSTASPIAQLKWK